MNSKELAGHFLRYWTAPSSPDLPGNAPQLLRKLAAHVQPTALPQLHDCLQAMANGGQPRIPGTIELLGWAANEAAQARCDSVLRGHQPPKNLVTVLRSAYLGELQALETKVKKYLTAYLKQESSEDPL